MSPHTIQFANQHQAQLGHLTRYEDLPQTFRSLGLEYPRPVIVWIVGAGRVAPQHAIAIRQAADVISRVAAQSGAAVIDGGTQAGGMEAMGIACALRGYDFPLIGVAARGTVILPSSPQGGDRWNLDPNHTHFILVPGDQWGDETPWISQVATQLAGALPSLTVLGNGGGIARRDVATSLESGRRVLVLKGTGRLADELASDPPSDPLVFILPVEDETGLEEALLGLL
jgi:hypothetical protein